MDTIKIISRLCSFFGQNTLEDIKRQIQVKADNETGYKRSLDNIDKKAKEKNP